MRETSKADLLRLWSALGLRPGELVMTHAFLPSLGRLRPEPAVFVESLVEHLGPAGTLVAPTFTYSFRRGEIFDPRESKSQVGIAGELVRKFPGAVRSLDPLFSMAAVGRDAAELMERRSLESFGPRSIYGHLQERGVKFLLVGVDFTGLSFFMHLERLHEVPYRQEMTFSGESRRDGGLVPDAAVHFAGREASPYESARERVGARIDEHPACIRAEFGYAVHRAVPATAVAETVSACLREDPLFLVKKQS